MPANPQPEAYPVFAELCLQARDMEKRLLEVRQKKSGSTLGLADGLAVFPKEFEGYTFAYALSEAQKIERKLFTSSYQAALRAPSQEEQAQHPSPADMDEREIESELHKFAAADKPDLKQQKISEPVRPGGLSIGPLKLPVLFGKKPSQIAQPPEEEPLRKRSSLPPEIQIASEAESSARGRLLQAQEAAPQKQAVERQGIKIPFIPKRTPVPRELPSAPQPPPGLPEGEGQGEIAKKESELEFGEGKPGEILQKEAQAAFGREEGGKPGSAELGAGPKIEKEDKGAHELPPAMKPSSEPSQSKIAPRLREIIEARLKKEEELSAQEESGEGEEKPLDAIGEPPGEGQPQEEIIMSARERMFKRRGIAPPKKTEKGAAAPGLEEAEEEQGDGGRKADEGLAPEPEAGKEEGPSLDERRAPAKGKPGMREEESVPEPELKAAPGGLLIKPIFEGQSEEEGAQKPRKKAGAADGPIEQERLRRIQKIIGELSEDKYKAGAIPEKEGERGEARLPKKKAKGKAELAQEEEIEPEGIPAEIAGENIPKAKAEPAQKAQAGKSAKSKTAISQSKVPVQVPKKAKGKAAEAKKDKRKPKGRGEYGEEKPAAAAPAQKKEAVSKIRPVQKGQRQEAAPEASLQPSQEEGEGKEGAPMLSARERLLAAIGEKNRRSPKPLDEEASEQPLPVQPAIKTRILPGGISVQQKGAMRTYVPPAREKIVPKIQAVQKGGREEAGEGPQEQPKPPGRRALPTMELVPKKLPKRQGLQGQSEAGEAGPAPEKGLQAPPPRPPARKQPPRQKEEAPEGEEEAPAHEEGEARPEEARKPPVQKPRDLAGEAEFPQDAEDDLEIPRPPSPEDEVPKPDEYEQAKEEFRHKLDQEEVRVNARAESDEILEQYAKENLVWLYEIYKMGGISRDDFLQKVREKSSDLGGAAPQGALPSNPALAAIGKELEKKSKK